MTGEVLGTLAILLIAIAGLLALVLRARMPAFIALILTSLGVGLALGVAPAALLKSMQDGMGSTLGSVAVIVGLGAMLGALLECTGGIQRLAQQLLSVLPRGGATTGLSLLGLAVAIPVFFDVAFILLTPLMFAMAKSARRPVIHFALPLLAGLAVGHTFIPPTPGPVAVAALLEANLGLVILSGLATGIPAAVVAGPLLVAWLNRRAPTPIDEAIDPSSAGLDGKASPGGVLMPILIVTWPLLLILAGALAQWQLPEGSARSIFLLFGHPFVALLSACLGAWLWLRRIGTTSAEQLRDVMTRALEPAGVVVLVTGAGGMFKQVLVDSGSGRLLAETLGATGFPVLAFAFATAAVFRVAQGSATVAMVAAAGLTAPLVALASPSPFQTALLVSAIASGATMLSHVNDSGFWLVNRYLQQTEAETLRTWTLASTLIGVTGFLVACLLWQVS